MFHFNILLISFLGPYCALIGARILILSALVRVKVVSKQEHILTFEVYISGLTQFMATVRIEMRPADEWLSPKIKSLMWELMVHKHRLVFYFFRIQLCILIIDNYVFFLLAHLKNCVESSLSSVNWIAKF